MNERLESDIEIKFSDCATCTHLGDGQKCPAFPLGIPEDIWGAGSTHREVRPDQTGDTIYAGRNVAK
jgi:hypothetical protein